METKFTLFLEHLHRDPESQGDVGSSATHHPPVADPTIPPPIVIDGGDFYCLETPCFQHHDSFDSGGFAMRPLWPHHLDFPYFLNGDDPSAWIYKVKQYFAYYHTPRSPKSHDNFFSLWEWATTVVSMARLNPLHSNLGWIHHCPVPGIWPPQILRTALNPCSNFGKQVLSEIILLNFVTLPIVFLMSALYCWRVVF